jgi:methyl-accepting chemotaxis protein
MNHVNTRSEQVSSFLDVVDEITEKTTLLSLNASIISAQAGEHGRGFAVVADEIRELSAQTKDSTSEISSIISSLRHEVMEGVKSVTTGLQKVDESVDLTNAVKESLDMIIQRAAQSSERASNTVQVIEKTVASSDLIQLSMDTLMEKTSDIREEIEKEERNLSQVVTSIDNIRSMSEQVKQANIEQSASAGHIEERMELFVRKLTGISAQTHELQCSSDQIVDTMRKIDLITEKILQNTTIMADHTIKNLVHQSGALKDGLSVFKVE